MKVRKSLINILCILQISALMINSVLPASAMEAFSLSSTQSTQACFFIGTKKTMKQLKAKNRRLPSPIRVFKLTPERYPIFHSSLIGTSYSDSRNLVGTRALPVMFKSPDPDKPGEVIMTPLTYAGNFDDLPVCKNLNYPETSWFRTMVVNGYKVKLPKNMRKVFQKACIYRWTFAFTDKDGIKRYYQYIGRAVAGGRASERTLVEECVSSLQGIFTQNIGFQVSFLETACSLDENPTLEILQAFDATPSNFRAIERASIRNPPESNKYKLLNIDEVVSPQENPEDVLRELGKQVQGLNFQYIESDYLFTIKEKKQDFSKNFKAFYQGYFNLPEESVKTLSLDDALAAAKTKHYGAKDLSTKSDAAKLAYYVLRKNSDDELPGNLDAFLKDPSTVHTQEEATPTLTEKTILSDEKKVLIPARKPKAGETKSTKSKKGIKVKKVKVQLPKKGKSPRLPKGPRAKPSITPVNKQSVEKDESGSESD